MATTNFDRVGRAQPGWWGAVRRLTTNGADPVVQLQTNFGGGKTHSMLALYRLFSDANPTELAGIDAGMIEPGAAKVPNANRVVLVGNKISPGKPSTKRGDCAFDWTCRCLGNGDARDQRRNPNWRAGSGGAHRNRKQSHAEI